MDDLLLQLFRFLFFVFCSLGFVEFRSSKDLPVQDACFLEPPDDRYGGAC